MEIENSLGRVKMKYGDLKFFWEKQNIIQIAQSRIFILARIFWKGVSNARYDFMLTNDMNKLCITKKLKPVEV